MRDPSSQLRTARRLAALFGSCSVALAAVLLLVLLREAPPSRPAGPLGGDAPDAAERAAAVQAMLSAAGGVFDSHPDAQVSRVLLADLVDQPHGHDRVSSNRFGLRERDWEQPRPAGVVRIVLLGDSFIHGMGVAAEERLGVHLQRLLAGLAAAPLEVEVLHLGITSWGLPAEVAFLRRRLALLQPDLVLHHVVPNDLDDTNGVRGWGVAARLAPEHPAQGDVVISATHGRWTFDHTARSLLAWGEDGESRARFRRSADEIERLSHAVAAAGGRYVLVINWHGFAGAAARWLAPRLAAGQVAWLGTEFYRDEAFRISRADEHWNPAGHRRMGEYLAGLVLERGLLPQLQARDAPELRATFAQMHAAGAAEVADPQRLEQQIERQPVRSELDLSAMTAETAAQVYGGVDREGLVGPYAALVLARAQGSRLVISGRGLARPELDGVVVSVHVDDERVGELLLSAEAPLLLDVPLPAAARARRWLAVRFTSDDFVHAGPDLRRTVCFRLERVAIE